MLDKFITNLSPEQKQELLEALQGDLSKNESTEPLSFPLQEEFVAPIKKTNQPKTKIPVTETERCNTFVDDGSESKGEEFETPQIEITERSRPPVKKVKQVCGHCGKTFDVHPAHARDWFICDKCVGAR